MKHIFLSNFVGYIQPDVLKARFEKRDNDGFLDRHWVSVTTRKKTYFKEIGAIANDDLDLSKLFVEVYKRHHIQLSGVSLTMICVWLYLEAMDALMSIFFYLKFVWTLHLHLLPSCISVFASHYLDQPKLISNHRFSIIGHRK